MPRIYPEEIKQKALELRKQGYTYSEIPKLLNYPIPKNTFTGWFKNVVLSQKAKNRIIERIRLGGAPGRAMAWKGNQAKRTNLLKSIYEKANLQVKEVDELTAKICLAMLYLGEGAKGKELFRFGNSDPRIIDLFLALLRKSFPIEEKKLRGKVQCRADQNIMQLTYFWSKLSKIPINQFDKAQVDIRTLGKPTKRINYKGVFVLTYYSNALFLELKFISDIIYSRVQGL